jgi:hypothetical protein
VKADKTGQVSYEGDAPLVFGFQAVRFYDQGRYTSFEPLDAGAKAAKALAAPRLPEGVKPLSTSRQPGPDHADRA